MKVDFERSGGFAGIRLHTVLDTDDLPDEAGSLLARLVDAADFFSLPPILEGSPDAADLYQYTVTVHDGARIHTVTLSEDAASAALRQLLDFLVRLAKKRHGG